MTHSSPASSRDLRPAERRFLTAMQQLGFGRFEHLRIERGEVVLDPWPTTIRDLKFGCTDSAPPAPKSDAFALKQQVAELFEYIRSVETGEIRVLEVKHGLPFAMEIELPQGGGRRA
jgi:hypothetical protein